MVIRGSGANQVVLFTHNDLDGVGCAILVKKVYGDAADIHMMMANESSEYITGWLNNTFQPNLHTFVFIADLSVDEETAKLLEEKLQGRCVLLDHHETAEGLSNHNWCNVKDTGVDCGTTLLLDYLIQSGNSFLSAYKDFAREVNSFDNQGNVEFTKTAYDLNLLLTILGKRYFISRFLEDPSPIFGNDENTLLALEYDRIKRFIYVKLLRSFVMDIESPQTGQNIRIAFAYANTYINDVATALLEKHMDAQAACVINLPNSLSLRLRQDADAEKYSVAKLAEALGGGGHPHASGIPFDYEENLVLAETFLSGKGLKTKRIEIPEGGLQWR